MGTMKNVQTKSQPPPWPTLTAKDRRVSETPGKRSESGHTLAGPDTTIGPSQVPAGATLPLSEPVIPGKGRSPK